MWTNPKFEYRNPKHVQMFKFHMTQTPKAKQCKHEPRNSSWITKVRASSWRTWQNKKLSYHHKGDDDLFYFTMHTNILHVFFAPNCRF